MVLPGSREHPPSPHVPPPPHPATRWLCDARAELAHGALRCVVLRYAIPSTDLAYGDMKCPVLKLAYGDMKCPVLSWRM
eukprot:1879043-Rhodomonas_salina.2